MYAVLSLYTLEVSILSKRSERIDVRVTPEEKSLLVSTATTLGITVTELLLSMFIGDKLGEVLKRSAD